MNIAAEFSGKRLMVIEDGYFLDDETRSLLAGMGVAALCVTKEDALRGVGVDAAVDGAVIDINFPPDVTIALDEMLEALGIPHLFAFAEPASYGLVKHPKPYRLCADRAEITATLRSLFACASTH